MSSPAATKAHDALSAHRSARVEEIVAQRRPLRNLTAVDVSRWPVLLATLTASNFTYVLDDITAAHLHGPFAPVVDVRDIPPLTSSQRHLITTARAADHARFPGVRRGCACVVANLDQERALLPLTWLNTVGYPLQTFTRVDFAFAWAEQLMRDSR